MTSPEPDDLLRAHPELMAGDGGAVTSPRRRRRPAAGRRRNGPRLLVAVSLGGALGAVARYGIAQLVFVTPGTFPWGTFWINISGSFTLGFVLVLVLERFPPSRYLRPFVATGFLGAYTTYSTFAVETDLLIRNGYWTIALAYAAASFTAGFAAVWAGMVLARAVPSMRSDRHAT